MNDQHTQQSTQEATATISTRGNSNKGGPIVNNQPKGMDLEHQRQQSTATIN
jgi:hypothetical protein